MSGPPLPAECKLTPTITLALVNEALTPARDPADMPLCLR